VELGNFETSTLKANMSYPNMILGEWY